jgi:predicted RNA-binding Zn-ribbon protein involved in translation (DUF1610 family)
MAGKQAKCPNCKSLMTLPDIVHEAEEIVPPPPSPPPAPASNMSSLFDEEAEYQLSQGPKINAPSSSEPPRRPCPMCGEMIAVGAAKCRYCDAIFDAGLRAIEKSKRRRSSSDGDSDMSAGDWVVAILCSGIGCIAGIVWMIQGKPKGAKMLGVSLAAGTFWTIVRVILEAAANH